MFKVASGGTETKLYSFCSLIEKCSDGYEPHAGLIADGSGNLYGTTEKGVGYKHCEPAHLGCSVVFKLSPDGTETVLHGFEGGGDGMYPLSGLIADSAGNLYGTTEYGSGACKTQDARGVVFEISK